MKIGKMFTTRLLAWCYKLSRLATPKLSVKRSFGSVSKKLILSFLSALILLQGTLSPALAQTVTPARWYDQSILEWYVRVFNTDVSPAQEIFGERYAAAQVQWILYSLLVFFMNLMFNSQ